MKGKTNKIGLIYKYESGPKLASRKDSGGWKQGGAGKRVFILLTNGIERMSHNPSVGGYALF